MPEWSEEIRKRLEGLRLEPGREAEIVEELAQHLEDRWRELRAAGLSDDQARAAALRELSESEMLARRLSRIERSAEPELTAPGAVGGARFIALVSQNLRYSTRKMRKSPGFTALVVLAMALGIGTNTAVFSVVNALLLRPLPIKEVDRVLYTLDMRENFDPFGAALVDAIALRNEAHSLEEIGFGHTREFRMLTGREPERVSGAAVSRAYLTTLGVEPSLGRPFLAEEDRPGGAPVALISHGFWQSHFSGDRAVMGRTVDLDDRNYTIIGVLPPGFDLPQATRVWVPLATDIDAVPLAQQISHDNFIVGRLKPGASLEQANLEATAIAQHLEQGYPQWRRNWGIKLIPLRQQLLGDVGGSINRTLILLTATVAFLLLLTCANVASLVLARSVERTHETAIQVALGASRWRLVSQSLTESVLLSLGGGAVGLLVSQLAAASMMSLKPVFFFTLQNTFESVQIDARVLAFTMAVSLAAGVVFGLGPAVRSAGPGNLADRLKEGGPRTGGGSGGSRVFRALIVGEIAVATTLLIGAGLMVESFQKLGHSGLGFRPDHLLAIEMPLSDSDYPRHVDRVRFAGEVLSRVRGLPGVGSAGISSNMPLAFSSWDASYAVEGKQPIADSEVPIAADRLVTPDYLEALGVSLVKGRLITEQDRAESLPIAVVSKEFAKQAWPGEDAIGKRVRRANSPTAGPWYTVVGVLEDVKEDQFNFRINRPVWYIPYSQFDNNRTVALLVRANGNPSALSTSIAEAIRSVNKNQTISDVTTMDQHIARLLGPDRFSAVLSSLFGALGLVLAALGICGVTAYSVIKEARAYCIRLAFGATWADLVRLILGRGVRLALLGTSIGCAGGLVLGRAAAGLLYEVSPVSLHILLGAPLILLLIVLAAMFLPALRLKRLDPIAGLRLE